MSLPVGVVSKKAIGALMTPRIKPWWKWRAPFWPAAAFTNDPAKLMTVWMNEKRT